MNLPKDGIGGTIQQLEEAAMNSAKRAVDTGNPSYSAAFQCFLDALIQTKSGRDSFQRGNKQVKQYNELSEKLASISPDQYPPQEEINYVNAKE